MMEITVTVNAPALAEAINNLAAAISGSQSKAFTAPELVEVQPAAQQPSEVLPMNPPVEAPIPQIAENATQQEAPAAPVSAAQPAQSAAPQPAASAPAPAPTASKPITLESLCEAGARLVESGHMNQVIGLLSKYGVQAINQLAPAHYDALAADLRAIGASI